MNEDSMKQNRINRRKKVNFDDVMQKDTESGVSDLNANHFFSANEIAGMATLSPENLTKSYKARTSRNEDVGNGNFSDHLKQMPRSESQRQVISNHDLLNPSRNSDVNIVSQLYTLNNKHQAPVESAQSTVALRNKLSISEQILLRDPKSALSQQVMQSQQYNPSTEWRNKDEDDEKAVWERYHTYLKEKYKQQSMVPGKIQGNMGSSLSPMSSKLR